MPAEGIEPPTFGLQNRCSTAELSRQAIEGFHKIVAAHVGAAILLPICYDFISRIVYGSLQRLVNPSRGTYWTSLVEPKDVFAAQRAGR